MQRSSLDPENRHKCCVFSCGRYTEPSHHHNTTAHTITDWQDDPRPLLTVDDEIHDFEVHREGAYAKGRTWVSLPNRKTTLRARQRRSASWWEQCIHAENEEDSTRHNHHDKAAESDDQMRAQTKSTPASPIGYRPTPPPLRRARASFGNPPPMTSETASHPGPLFGSNILHRRHTSEPVTSLPTEVGPHYTYFLAPPKSTAEQRSQNVHVPHPSVPALSVSPPEGSFVRHWARATKEGESIPAEAPSSSVRLSVRREAFIPAAILGAGPDALAFDPRPPLKLEREVHDFECHKQGSHAAGHTFRGLRAEFRQLASRQSSIIGGKHGSKSASRSGSAQSSAASTPRYHASDDSRAHHLAEPSRTANLPQ